MRIPPRRRPLHAVVHRAVSTAFVLSLTLGALSGCSAAPAPASSGTARPVTEATAAPTEAPPVFASNEEALAAAEAAYAKYLSLGDSARTTDSDSWEEYLALTTGSEHDGAEQAGRLMEEKDWIFTGVTLFDSMTIQSSRALADSTWEIRTYLCLDLSASDTVNAAGESVVKHDEPRSPMIVVFVTPDKNSRQLLISESPIWSGSNFCS
ncbi:hypothetical protein E3O25_12805 [Cryobacterium sp. TMT1-3]|uniref:hypothetical protein n=1 Tax=Cryobacterium sp. TMT1-3 TaxID=1259237 RepID=UPI001069BF0D|nr:hypothetical protein [Cryobacterium sp. TMT1-3]TFC25487.1 hypothetical protein E3O25_12805 [Cryobacterium sp. TMT1-3]